jgi:hypothetical protein
MFKNLPYKILRLLNSIFLPILLVSIFVLVHIFYGWIGNQLININNQNTLSLITSLLSSAATTFAALTAAVLVLNWKSQHNLSLISKLITEVWELHGQFTSKVYVLT